MCWKCEFCSKCIDGGQFLPLIAKPAKWNARRCSISRCVGSIVGGWGGESTILLKTRFHVNDLGLPAGWSLSARRTRIPLANSLASGSGMWRFSIPRAHQSVERNQSLSISASQLKHNARRRKGVTCVFSPLKKAAVTFPQGRRRRCCATVTLHGSH